MGYLPVQKTERESELLRENTNYMLLHTEVDYPTLVGKFNVGRVSTLWRSARHMKEATLQPTEPRALWLNTLYICIAYLLLSTLVLSDPKQMYVRLVSLLFQLNLILYALESFVLNGWK